MATARTRQQTRLGKVGEGPLNAAVKSAPTARDPLIEFPLGGVEMTGTSVPHIPPRIDRPILDSTEDRKHRVLKRGNRHVRSSPPRGNDAEPTGNHRGPPSTAVAQRMVRLSINQCRQYAILLDLTLPDGRCSGQAHPVILRPGSRPQLRWRRRAASRRCPC